MTQETPQYMIFVAQKGEADAMLAAPLEDDDRDYFVNGILPALRPLSDEDYMQGPAVMLHTAARFSYIVFRDDVYWCVEWDPGLIVVRFSPDGTMAWTALRSPIPDFGGRTPLEEDLRDYDEADEDAENHQYNLVFKAWDAQFDEDWRKWRSFKPADAQIVRTYQAALAHVLTLGEQMEVRYSGEDKYHPWVEQCERNMEKWAGEGVRVKL